MDSLKDRAQGITAPSVAGRVGQSSEGLPANFGAASATTLAVALFGTAALIQDPRYAGFNLLFGGDAKVVTGDSGSAAGCEGGGCGGCGGYG